MTTPRFVFGWFAVSSVFWVWIGSAGAASFVETFDPPTWLDNQAIQGNNGWSGSAGTIRDSGWGMTPVSGSRFALHRVDTTAAVDARLFHDIAAPATTNPFMASVYIAHNLQLQSGANARTQFGFFTGDTSNFFRGVVVGIKSSGGSMYLYAYDGVSDTEILLDAVPGNPGTNPVTALTWYRFDLWVQPGSPHSTYNVFVYNLAGDLLGEAHGMTTRNHVSGESFSKVFFRIENTSTGISKDVRAYYDSLSVVLPEPASVAFLGLGLMLFGRRPGSSKPFLRWGASTV